MADRWNRLIPPASAPTAHLDDAELTAVERTMAAQKHLENCVWCKARFDEVSPQDRSDLDDLLSALDAAPVPGNTISFAGSFALPTALSRALDADVTSAPEVGPAQLWRLTWQGRDALAVVLERNSWWVTVAPLSTDIELADEYTALCDEDATTLGTQTAVFMRAATTVPQYTLSRYLGPVQPTELGDAARWLRELHNASIQQTAPSRAGPTGRPLAADDWDRQQALDAMLEEMSWFGAAERDVLDEDGEIVGRDSAAEFDEGEATDIVELLHGRGVNLADLAAATGISSSRLVDLSQGSGKPSAAERRALSEYFGVPVTGSYPEVARLALLEVVSEPSHRNLWIDSAKSSEPMAVADTGTLRPLLEMLLRDKLAGRTVTGAERDISAGLDAWRAHWRDVLAMMHR